MASTRININPSGSPVAPQFIAFLSQLADLRDQANRLHNMGESAVNGSDWDAFNQMFIGQVMPQGFQPYEVYNLFNAVVPHLNDAAVATLLSRLGQR